MKKIFLILTVLCGIGLVVGCKSDIANEKTNYHFRPICSRGDYTYGYVSAKTYGVSGNHERIMVQRDTNNIDSNYIFYGNVIYLTPSCDILTIFVPDVFVKKDAVFDDPNLEVIVLDRTKADLFASGALKRNYYEISVYEIMDDTIFLQ